MDSCYWITGYSIAGGVASHVSPYIIGKGEVYTYTFGAMNTTKGGRTANQNIKNIINEDDLIPKVVNREESYGRIGAMYNDSIYDNLHLEYNKYAGEIKDYQVSPKKTNTIKSIIKKVNDNVSVVSFKEKLMDAMSKYFANYTKVNEKFNHRVSAKESRSANELKEVLNSNIEKVRKAHEIKAYYTLAKTLNGFDMNKQDIGWTEVEEEITSDNIEIDNYDHMYVEVDWEIGYSPNKEQLEIVAESFKRQGIILHIDAGEYSVNYGEREIQKYGTGYNIVDGLQNESKLLQLGTDRDLIEEIVERNFSKREKFRYCMYLEELLDYNPKPNTHLAGIADDIDGRMFILSKNVIRNYSFEYFNYEAAVFMHELGHTLGLHHGGDDELIFKPNYVSIMNYLYCNYGGLIADYDVDYSEYEFPEMKFDHIDERKGIDPYNIGKNLKGIKWFLICDDKNNPSQQYYNDNNRSINFNKNVDSDGKPIIETDVSIDFYLENIWYESFYDKFIAGLYNLRYCRKSINDWKVILKHLNPKKNINYDELNRNEYGEGTN